jgi:hypothetical protein
LRIEAGHPNGSLVLLGTVHGDPRGYARLTLFLKKENPDSITVEISPYARNFRREQGAVLRRVLRDNLWKISIIKKQPLRKILAHPAILGIFFLLKEPYEWRAARDYARENKRCIEDIDLSAYSEQKLAHLMEIISLKNLMTLWHLPFEDLLEQVEIHYRRARILFSHPPSIRVRAPEIAVREASMAEKIRRRVLYTKGKKLVHIGGWEHLVDFPEKNSLWGRLRNLNPRRVLLC